MLGVGSMLADTSLAKRIALTTAALGLSAAAIAAVLLWASAGTTTSESRPLWHDVPWPFPMDQWGQGRAFRCAAADCGVDVSLYLRPKLGACNCATGVATDDELDRMGDLELVDGQASPLGPGRPVTVGPMRGRSRIYAVAARSPKTAISIAVNDRCDMLVATAALPNDRATSFEPHVLSFLNSAAVLRWVEITLGL
jgi:hypothetical protein